MVYGLKASSCHPLSNQDNIPTSALAHDLPHMHSPGFAQPLYCVSPCVYWWYQCLHTTPQVVTSMPII